MDDEYDIYNEVDSDIEADIESNPELNGTNKKEFIFLYTTLSIIGAVVFVLAVCIGVTLLYIYSL